MLEAQCCYPRETLAGNIANRVLVRDHGIIYCEAKEVNMFLTEDDVLKTVDFGISEIIEKDSDLIAVSYVSRPSGVSTFLPPEFCITKHSGIFSKAGTVGK